MPKVTVYNLDDVDSDRNEFVVGVNGITVQGQCEKEVNMKEEFIQVLENAVVDTEISDPVTNKRKRITKPRFRVIRSTPKK